MIQYFPIVTGSLTVLGNINVSGSITTSGSITISGSITSASFATSASNATNAISASYANNLTVAGTLTAQTIVVQTITSSVDYITGSSINGSLSTNTHLFTGSVSISGSSTAFAVNNSAFFISSSGNIGIGTTISNAGSSVSGTTVVTIAPQSSVSERWGILELAGNRTLGENQVGEIKFTNINTTNNVVASISGNNTTTGVTGGSLSFSTKTDAGSLTERMRITPSGSVGIGTSSPAQILHIYGNSIRPQIEGTGNGGYSSLRFVGKNSGGTSRTFEIGLNITADDVWQVTNGSSAFLNVNTSGNVGINTNTPATYLHVLGANTSGRGQLSIQSNNSSNAAKATWYYDTTLQGEIGTTSGDFYSLAVNNFLFYAGGSERMRITSNGNLKLNNSLISSFTANPSNLAASATYTYTITQPTYEYQSAYIIDVVGLSAPSGTNVNCYYYGIAHFFNDSSVATAAISGVTGNNFTVSVNATTGGAFNFVITNTSTASMGNIAVRILKINRTGAD